eukprot:scaffold6641_cov39-Phaeocystis_antarctica.AAC.2
MATCELSRAVCLLNVVEPDDDDHLGVITSGLSGRLSARGDNQRQGGEHRGRPPSVLTVSLLG